MLHSVYDKKLYAHINILKEFLLYHDDLSYHNETLNIMDFASVHAN